MGREPVSATADIYVLTLANKTVRRIVSTPGPDDAPVWSPDGQQIAFKTSDGNPHFLFSNQKIAVVSTDGSMQRSGRPIWRSRPLTRSKRLRVKSMVCV